ncbi:hypothetical protein ACL7TT_20300 [Microbulbifer sp. 2304DJ12-6]|uniref:hypothetical protein n=1 Tax=Microbulbifer sp. 2304DJ12-6 TaxID=3233340 RepID=UPI0039AFCB6E
MKTNLIVMGKTLYLIALFCMPAVFAQAQDNPGNDKDLSREDLEYIIERDMPKVLGENNVELLTQMLQPNRGNSLYETFDGNKAVNYLFKGKDVVYGKECDKELYPQGQCDVVSGSSNGEEEYSKFSFNNNLSLADIRFSDRPAFGPAKKVEISNQEAFYAAKKFLIDIFGISEEEIPTAPSNASNPYPVKTVNMAYSDGAGSSGFLPVEKLVSFPRGLFVKGGLGWIPGPGRLKVTIDDQGINTASVSGWADLSGYGLNLDPRDAKSRRALVSELATRLQDEGINSLNSTRGVLAIALPVGAKSPIPVLRVYAAALERDLDEKSQGNNASSAGVVLDIPLLVSIDESKSIGDGE